MGGGFSVAKGKEHSNQIKESKHDLGQREASFSGVNDSSTLAGHDLCCVE